MHLAYVGMYNLFDRENVSLMSVLENTSLSSKILEHTCPICMHIHNINLHTDSHNFTWTRTIWIELAQILIVQTVQATAPITYVNCNSLQDLLEFVVTQTEITHTRTKEYQHMITCDRSLGQQRLSVCPPRGYTTNSSVLLS